LKLVVLEFNSFQFDSSCIVMLFMPQFHINKLMSLISRTFEFFSCFTRINLSFFIFSIFLVLVQIRIIYCMLHIASYHRYPLVKIHLYQGYFNMSHHWHMNMCCLIKLHENILTLFKGLSTNEQMWIQKGENGKMTFAFHMWKQPWWSCFNIMHDVQSPLYFFFSFIHHKLYKIVWFLIII
jgi:hypothetical protein